MLSRGTEEPTLAPFPAGLLACMVHGLNEDPLLFEVFFLYVTDFYLSHLC